MDFHNRSYDPQLGRFLSPDPLADEGGQQILSPFHAMGCDPVNMVDPLGLQSALPGSWQAGQPTMRDLAYLIPPSLLADYDFNSQHIFNATDRIKERMLEDALTGYLGFVFEQWSKNYGGLTFANGQLYIHSNTVTEGNDRGVEYSFNSSGRKVYYEGLNNRVVTGTTTVFNLGVGLGYVAPPSLYQEHVDDFEGFFGKINYIFSDGIAHGAYYDWDGNYVRPAPMTGMPPDVAIGRGVNAFKWVSKLAKARKSSYLVYQGFNAAGEIKYVGITKRAASVRFGEHLNSVGTGKELLRYEVIDGATGLSRNAARVMEQTMINQYGLQKNGGILLNQINSIAPKYWTKFGLQ